MGKEVIAVDVDEVLFPFLPEFTRHHNRLYATDISPNDFLSYEFEHVLCLPVPEVIKRVFAFHETDLVQVEPISEAQEVLYKMADLFDLKIITARDPKFGASTGEWVEKNFANIFSDIVSIGHPALMEVPRTKAMVCRDIGAVALVDDSISHSTACAVEGIEGILFGDYPWNQAEQLPKGVTRCKDWPAVLEYFDARA